MAESSPRQQLEWLAAAYGLDAGYEDVWGRRREVSEAGLRALLGQLGVAAETDEEVERSLAATHPRYWKRLAEPVLAVTLPASRLELLLRCPREGGERVAWRLVPEEGAVFAGELEGEAALDALPLREQTEVDGHPHESRVLAIRVPLAAGYHRLHLCCAGREASVLVIAAPPRCFQPPSLAYGARVWGWSVQLYALRSPRNWGIGDFGDLLALIDVAAARGASAIGLNPLHARFPHNPAHASPYSPSSRLWLDVLAIDVESLEDYAEDAAVREHVRSDGFAARLEALRASELVDFVGVSEAKHEVLGRLYQHFRSEHLARDTARAAAFRSFQAGAGAPLRRHALFEALQERFHDEDPSVWGWPAWPEAWRDAAAPQVRQFEAQALERIEYYEYLQWQAVLQLARASAHCHERNMAIGLYLDLAVSVDRAGSDCWSFASCYAASASVGAPPDEFGPLGQNWGLPPLVPQALRERGHEPLVLALRANMRYAGALRIDHVMGLLRLYWVPPGAPASDGGYVRYPLDELLAIVALESHRSRCLVVGEDLGTVPGEMREAMARTRMLSYRLLYFERDEDGRFLPPAAYPRDALVSIGTHDLPTLAGWWSGHDLRLRGEMGLYPDEAMQRAQARARDEERVRLVEALVREARLPADADVAAIAAGPLRPALVDAVHLYLAAAPSRLMMIQPQDWLDVVEQSNLPGTHDEHPNWRRKLPLTIEGLAEEPAGERLAAALSALRSRPRALARSGGLVRRHAQSAPRARVPRATCRLQLHARFGFAEAQRALPYLERLGIDWLYCSPVQRARPGSTHGYDIVDHRTINPELGGEAGFEALAAALRERGMGLLLDVVPNHMGVLSGDNAWWTDVLEHGEASRYAHFFDIDWHPRNADLDGKVLVPLLGDPYGEVLQRGELVLRFEAESGRFALHYHEHRLPIDPRESAALLRRALAMPALARDDELRDAVGALAAELEALPPRQPGKESARAEAAPDGATPDEARPDGRASVAGQACARLARLALGEPALREGLDAAVAALNAPSAAARDALHALLERQAWRLAYWRVASDEINYRRFFDINGLAGLRMEDEAVFEATHARVLELVATGRVDGLRIDHPDGLFDPGQYFERLQARCSARGGATAQDAGDATPTHAEMRALARGDSDPADAEDGRPPRPLYVVIEKIAASHEQLPLHWPIHGSTGYRFMSLVTALFVDAGAKARMDRTWRAFTGEREDFEAIAYRGKLEIMRGALASELTVLSDELLRIARADRRTRDYTFNTLRQAIAEVAARLPVYRSYLTDRPASPQDRRYIDWAIGQAVARSRSADTTVFGFVREALLGRAPAGAPAALRARTRRFARRFQQFSSPVAAKGVEDTALYRFPRLVSLNEVGSEPEAFGLSVRAFHAANADRRARWPQTLLATSTHDNKRSADVRARLDVLSEMPAAWRLLVRRWRLMNRSRRRPARGRGPGRSAVGVAPSPNDEYLLYQVLLGTFLPEDDSSEALAAYADRIEGYAIKAAREAKLQTSWVNPDPGYEQALAGFVRALLTPSASNPFLDDLREQVAPIAWFGALNSLAMVALQHTAPGVPDLYQGNECFDFSLVDPDNRRPVDFEQRLAILDELEARLLEDGLQALAAQLSREPRSDRAKLFVVWRLLQLRRAHPGLFRDGDYLPLPVAGARAEHLVAFARRDDEHVLVVLAGRLFARLLGVPGSLPTGEAAWGDTEVDLEGLELDGRLVDVLSGTTLDATAGLLAASTVLTGFPAAVLLARASDPAARDEPLVPAG